MNFDSSMYEIKWDKRCCCCSKFFGIDCIFNVNVIHIVSLERSPWNLRHASKKIWTFICYRSYLLELCINLCMNLFVADVSFALQNVKMWRHLSKKKKKQIYCHRSCSTLIRMLCIYIFSDLFVYLSYLYFFRSVDVFSNNQMS